MWAAAIDKNCSGLHISKRKDLAVMSDMVIQIIGFVGVAFFILSFQMKSNKMLFMMQMIGCALLALQFGLLGALTGSGSLYHQYDQKCCFA